MLTTTAHRHVAGTRSGEPVATSRTNPDGSTERSIDGLLHRADGPAVTHPDGSES